MSTAAVLIRVPATTANLGPGFDCLALALDLWNECTIRAVEDGFHVEVSGEGAGILPADEHNLIVQAFFETYRRAGKAAPDGLGIRCQNRIPLGSGLGSSAAAVLTGVMAANAFLGEPFVSHDILRITAELEGHADNAASALYGGLVVNFIDARGDLKVHKLSCAVNQVVVVLPEFQLSTRAARQVLPDKISLQDGVFNLGHAVLTVEALRSGNYELLLQAMEDRLQQPYRLGLIPGADAAIQAASNLGAPAALSGAGPGVVAFPHGNPGPVISAMQSAFKSVGLASRIWTLKTTYTGLFWQYE
jgi:homoserine kinase